MREAEQNCLFTCALRFDGYKYEESQADFDSQKAFDQLIENDQLPPSKEGQLALFFFLQRALGKFGLEQATAAGRYWRAFRRLFLQVHTYEIPLAFRHEEYWQQWQEEYEPRQEAWVAFIRQIHENITYVSGSGTSMEQHPLPAIYNQVSPPPRERQPAAIKETPPKLELKPPPQKPKANPKPKPDLSAQPALVTEFTPPSGGYAQRLKRVMALGQPKTKAELVELIAALGDGNANIRWLAGSSLARLGGLTVVNLLARYLETEPGNKAQVQVLKTLQMIADTDEDKAVQTAALKASKGGT